MRVRGLAVLLAMLVGHVLVPAHAVAAGGVLYVDGKTGSDSNDGLTPATALKTISRAASGLPDSSGAAGWTLSVKGYSDYVYRERPIPPGWNGRGAAGAPVTFEATGYTPGAGEAYVKPIVSGADVAPRSGQSWSATSTAGVWRTPWATAPFGWGKYSGSLRTALFQDGTTWLWEQSSLSALASRAANGKGGYWYDTTGKQLYVSGVGAVGTTAQRPASHTIEVVMRNAFLFMGTEGVAYVSVLGFEVRHSANGIAFVKGTDHGTAADNTLTGNLLMGIQTSGAQTTSGPNPSTGNVIERNVARYNTLQAIKIDEGTQSTRVCNNVASRNGLQGIKVQGPPGGTSYTGSTSGILVCKNTLTLNNYNPTGSTYNNASGLTVANGAKSVTVDGNVISANDVGILVTQEATGRALIDGLVLKRNDVNKNRRFGLYIFDGYKGSTRGKGSLRSSYDVYWQNGIGIMVGRGSTNKAVSHATIHGNKSDGVRIGEAGKSGAALTLSTTLVTANRGYGVWLVTGSSGSLKYVGISGNGTASTKGSLSKTAVNTRWPGYLSTNPDNAAFLRISTTSYQYTAGPSGTPVGARYS
jgi:hypothetical protein